MVTASSATVATLVLCLADRTKTTSVVARQRHLVNLDRLNKQKHNFRVRVAESKQLDCSVSLDLVCHEICSLCRWLHPHYRSRGRIRRPQPLVLFLPPDRIGRRH